MSGSASDAATDVTVTAAHSTSSQQWLRTISLIVGNDAGDAIDLSNLRISFSVTHAEQGTPKALQARVYNPDTGKTVPKVQREFTRVILSAGYQSNAAVIFTGTIRQVRYGRENPTDTFLEIYAADGDAGYALAVVNKVLAAGHTPIDVHNAVCSFGNPFGVTAGTAPPTGPAAIRPKVMFGPMRDFLRSLSRSTASTYTIVDGAVTFAPLQATQTTAIVLSPSTGLIGIPRQTPNGVEATALLNPRLRVGRYVKIDMGLILAQQADLSWAASNANQTYAPNGRVGVSGISSSGIYRIVAVDQYGDSRGDPWYSNIVCFADNSGAVESQSDIASEGFA